MTINLHMANQCLGGTEKILGRAHIPRIGWETDNHVALVQYKKGKLLKLIGTNHGAPVIIDPTELRADMTLALECAEEMRDLLEKMGKL